MTKLLAVFGNPILHSKSPQLFNAAFAHTQQAARYTRINPMEGKHLVATLRALNLWGANVTAPYKEDALATVDRLSDEARAIGAVNTIVNDHGTLTGHNTDHHGVTTALTEAGIAPNGAKCLILGAGGAARAVAYGLRRAGAHVAICNRTRAKAQTIANDFGCELLDWNAFPRSTPFDVVVSTLLPEVEPPFVAGIAFHALLDASYRPSRVWALAKAKGCTLVGGERWLVHQAVEAYRLLFGQRIAPAVMEAGLPHALKPQGLRVGIIEPERMEQIQTQPFDLLVPALWAGVGAAKRTIDEEIRRAFGG